MFLLHEKTRRRICRIGFVIACLIPTAAVLGWVAVEHYPGRVDRASRRLEQELKLHVELADLSHPRQGVTVFHQIRLADPDRGQTVLSCRRLEAIQTDNALVLVAAGLELESESLDVAWRLLSDQMRHLGSSAGLPVRLVAGELTLNSKIGRSQTFTHVLGEIEPSETGAVTSIRFQLPEDPSDEQIWIRFARHRGATSEDAEHETPPQTTEISIQTGGNPLPCSAFVSLFPALRHFGTTAKFGGSLWFDVSDADWSAEITGVFLDVDLERLVSDQFPHKLSGLANLTIQKARFSGGRLQDATLTVEGGPGVVGRSLLGAADTFIRGATSPSFSEEKDFIRYQRIGMSLEITPGEMSIVGMQGQFGNGSIITTDNGPLLTLTQTGRQPVLNLVRMLVPDNRVNVPATQETDWLIRRLPVPKIIPTPGTKSPPKLRFGGAN